MFHLFFKVLLNHVQWNEQTTHVTPKMQSNPDEITCINNTIAKKIRHST